MHHARASTTYAGALEGEPEEALKGFHEVISMEGEQGEWHVPIMLPFQPVCFFVTTLIRPIVGICILQRIRFYVPLLLAAQQNLQYFSACRGFKALKQVVKLHFKLHKREAMLEAYKYVQSRPHVMLHGCCHIARISAAHRVQLHATICL